MENTKKKKSRLGPSVILAFALISAVLIVAELATNLSVEIDSQQDSGAAEVTVEPSPNVRPTYPPDYTPPPINDTQP